MNEVKKGVEIRIKNRRKVDEKERMIDGNTERKI